MQDPRVACALQHAASSSRRAPPDPRSSAGRTGLRSSARQRPRRPGTDPFGNRRSRGSSSSGGSPGSTAWLRSRAPPSCVTTASRSNPRGSWITYTNQPRRACPRSRREARAPDLLQRLAVEARHPLATGQQLVESLELRQPKRTGDVRQAVVEAQPVVVEPVHVGRTALIALGVDALLERRVACTTMPPSPVVICLLA